jgi:23S rRNA (cytidine1920-2'-O)/16S rRNA (cytidine1409-2'-O)-methyltransferase
LRLDQYLVEKGLAPTREKAQALIMSGLVLVDGKTADKPGQRVKENAKVEIKEPFKYVSRGGYKLEHALEKLGLSVEGFTVLDVGASTGGFTDCLLQRGAKKVYAVDVGRTQMDQKLRQDSRVVLYEETDARELTEEHIPEKVDLITMDVSFISSKKLLPIVVKFLKEEGFLLVLVKPQFELHPKFVKKGVVKDDEKKAQAVLDVANFLKGLGFSVLRVIKAKPRGTKGNEEFFLFAKRGKNGIEDLEVEVCNAVKEPL